jgi:hypothetical protein
MAAVKNSPTPMVRHEEPPSLVLVSASKANASSAQAAGVYATTMAAANRKRPEANRPCFTSEFPLNAISISKDR